VAFNPLKRIFFRSEAKKPQPPVSAPESRETRLEIARDKSPSRRRISEPGRRFNRSDASPYTVRPALARENMERLEKSIRKSPARYRTDRLTLLEIADLILQKEIAAPRPPQLRAHHVFAMFLKKSGRQRSGVSGVCHEWQGAFKAGAPAITTVNAIHGHRLVVDARKYILENPVTGKRRNFRSKPHSTCGNHRCVNPRHIEMRGLPRELKSGENHARAKYSDKVLQKLVREYNKGFTAKQLAKRYGMSITYVEQVMRKERRTKATQGMKIRGRFGSF
jgi:hypothetical protein